MENIDYVYLYMTIVFIFNQIKSYLQKLRKSSMYDNEMIRFDNWVNISTQFMEIKMDFNLVKHFFEVL